MSEIPGIHTRCNPGCDATALSRRSKSARAPDAMNPTRMTRAARLLMLACLAHARNSKLPFQAGQFLEIDRADDVDDRELPRLCRQNHESGNGIASSPDVDLRILFGPALDRHDALPLWSERRTQSSDDV